jgi:hypothetical protein
VTIAETNCSQAVSRELRKSVTSPGFFSNQWFDEL